FLFQQFLLLFLVTPITGAMSLAAHAVVGEKQARTLEPLLATPITTLELLVAKVLGALIPTLAISVGGLALYLAGIAAFGEPGVFARMFCARPILLIVVLGPAAALVSLQAAIVISSRVNDPRTAQQFGVLIILPLTAVFVAQFTGSWWLSTSWLLVTGLGLVLAWVFLVLFSVALFERGMRAALEEGRAAGAKLRDPRERLRSFARLHLRRLGRDRNLAIVFQVELRQSTKFMERFSSTLLRDYLGLIREAIEDGQRDGVFRSDIKPTVAAKILFGALDEMATNWILSRRRYSLEAEADVVVDLFLNGAKGARGR